MIRAIPLPQNESNFEVITDLDGTDFRLRFLWNDRLSRWSLTLYDSSGTQIHGAMIVVVDMPIYYRDTSEDAPKGDLYCVDITGEGRDPGLRDLGRRCQLIYVDEESLV